MAWTTRDHHRRRLDQACQDIERSLLYLKEFSDLYSKDNPILAVGADTIAQSLVMAQETIVRLKAAF